MQQRHPDDFFSSQNSSQQSDQQHHIHNNKSQSNNPSSSKSTIKQSNLSKFIEQISPQVLQQMKNYLSKYQQPPYNLWNSNDPHKISLFQDIVAIVYLKERQDLAFSNHQNLRKIINQIANKINRKFTTVEQRLKKKLSHLSNLAITYLIRNNKELKFIGNSRKFNVQGWPQNVVLSLYQNSKEKFHILSREDSVVGGLDLDQYQNQQQREKRLESRKKQEERIIKRRFQPLNKNLLQQKSTGDNNSNKNKPTISINTMIKNSSQFQPQIVFKQSKNSTKSKQSTQVSQRHSQQQIEQKQTKNYTQKTHQNNNSDNYENQFQRRLNEWKCENAIKVKQEQRNRYFWYEQDIVDRDQQRGHNSFRKSKQNPYIVKAFQRGIGDYNNKINNHQNKSGRQQLKNNDYGDKEQKREYKIQGFQQKRSGNLQLQQKIKYNNNSISNVKDHENEGDEYLDDAHGWKDSTKYMFKKQEQKRQYKQQEKQQQKQQQQDQQKQQQEEKQQSDNNRYQQIQIRQRYVMSYNEYDKQRLIMMNVKNENSNSHNGCRIRKTKKQQQQDQQSGQQNHYNNNNNNKNRKRRLRNPIQILHEMGRTYAQENKQKMDSEINELIQVSMKVSNLLNSFNQQQSK